MGTRLLPQMKVPWEKKADEDPKVTMRHLLRSPPQKEPASSEPPLSPSPIDSSTQRPAVTDPPASDGTLALRQDTPGTMQPMTASSRGATATSTGALQLHPG